MRKVHIVLLLACCLCAPISGRTDTSTSWPKPAPNVYYLEHFNVADMRQTVWLVVQSQTRDAPQGLVYPTLASPALRRWVGTLPPKAVIWYEVGGPYVGLLLGKGSPKGAKIDHHVKPGDIDLYGYDLTADEQAQFHDLYRFCQSKHVTFSVSAGPNGFY